MQEFAHDILFLFSIRLTATKEQHLRPPLLAQCRQSLQIWVSSLPDHLQFTEDTLEKQIAMFETSSNSGAWCYCYIHTLHPCYVLDLTEVRSFVPSISQANSTCLLSNFFPGRGQTPSRTDRVDQITAKCYLQGHRKPREEHDTM